MAPFLPQSGDLVAVDPRGADLKRYLAEDPGGPVVMLNVEHFRKTAAPFHAEVLYVGEGSTALVAEAGQSWDAVLLVRYPSRQVFSDMVRDPDYGTGTHLRTEALDEAVLQATSEWSIV
jgi:uncharacterized protein (DUF1330 family)